MITKEQFADEFAELAAEAGIKDTCAIEISERMARVHRRNKRRYAEVEPYALHFHFAPEVLSLPWQHRRGLIMHEIGHVLCPEGSEAEADAAAREVFGEVIVYDRRWPGKGLQCVRARANPTSVTFGVAQEQKRLGPLRPILLDGYQVGYISYGVNTNGDLEIDILGIDKVHRGKGYGRDAVEKVFQLHPRRDRIVLYAGMKSLSFWLRIGARPIPGGELEDMEIFREAVRANPPYQGWQKDWYMKPLPGNLQRFCYRTKTDALNVFLDHNRQIVDEYGGEDMVHDRASFDAINNLYDIPPRREVDTIAKAVWWAMPQGKPWCLENIDVELLNQTAPAVYNRSGLVFRLPDHVEEAELLRKEEEYWRERYGEVGYPEPF